MVGFCQLRHFDIFVDDMAQRLQRRAEADRWDLGLAAEVAAVGAEVVVGDRRFNARLPQALGDGLDQPVILRQQPRREEAGRFDGIARPARRGASGKINACLQGRDRAMSASSGCRTSRSVSPTSRRRSNVARQYSGTTDEPGYGEETISVSSKMPLPRTGCSGAESFRISWMSSVIK